MLDLHLTEISHSYAFSKSCSDFSIRSVNLDIREGERFAILGASGSGKTTLLKLIAGLMHPGEGTIRLGSTDLTAVPAERRGFGMVFQQSLLFPHMTVMDNVAFGLKMKGMDKRERQARAMEMIAAVGLDGYEHRYPGELSGGQQQRVSLARSIVIGPQLLLLDEPFSSLDPGIRTEMRQLVAEIHRKFKMTMLLVTHDRDEAFELADGIITEHSDKVWMQMDVEKFQHISEENEVRGIPSLLVYKDGQKIGHLHSKFAKMPDQIKEFLSTVS